MIKTTKLLYEVLFIFYIMNFIQKFDFLKQENKPIVPDYLFVINLFLILSWIFIIILGVKNKTGFFYKFFVLFFKMKIPSGLKIISIVVFIGNVFAISIGKPNYPFYDVGMFRWASKKVDFPEVLYEPQYYFIRNGKIKIVNIRREGYFLFHKYWGWGFTHEFTFSSAYHNKAQKNNFIFISNRMKKIGIDTLWVGISSVNFKTKIVHFDSDICNAIRVNGEKNIYYGPIYIPEYQYAKCN